MDANSERSTESSEKTTSGKCKTFSRNTYGPVHCLVCCKPQKRIEDHLRSSCLPGASDSQIQAEVFRTKKSQKKWAERGRTLNFSDVRRIVREDPSCDSLCQYFRKRGFFITEENDSGNVEESEILAVAEVEMGDIYKRLCEQEGVPEKSKTVFRSFCLATLMWVHHQPPRGIKEFKVQEWSDRTKKENGVLVRLSKEITVNLSKKEEKWLDCYFTYIRPGYLKCQTPDGDDADKFFLGASGVPLVNPSADVQRLRQKYMKRIRDRAATPLELQTGMVVHAPGMSADQEPQQSLDSTLAPAEAVPLPRLWGNFEAMFPVTLHGNPPSMKKATEMGFGDRSYYFYWRRVQYKMRARYILEQSIDRTGKMPQEARVKRAIERETAWTTNVPSVKDVLLLWEPCEEPSVDPDDVLLINRVIQQKWKGLAIKQIEGKGKGVIATMTFKKNQIVCDYHGEIVSKQEGERRLENLKEEPSYLFFFKGKAGEPLCIDAQKYPCDCHPDQETYGRRMNHSRRSNNVRPQRVSLNLPDGARECVILLALRDIGVNEELLWDYGIRRSSFGGEGSDLSWLDD